jgi:hypothetical protein
MNKAEADIEKEVAEIKHKLKMEEILADRKNIQLSHDLQLEVIRIKSAEIRRSQERKDFERYSR